MDQNKKDLIFELFSFKSYCQQFKFAALTFGREIKISLSILFKKVNIIR